ncbi:MAG: diheme cytochrome c [Rhodospirillales bacterium]
MKKLVLLALFALLAPPLAAPAHAERFPPVDDPTVKAECGACHMVYFPQMLPQKSWKRILGNLSNHFGEDASLDAAALKAVLAYHLANAADVSGVRAAGKWRQGLSAGDAPERITTTPRFLRKHDEIQPSAWSDPRVGSKANCGACHKGVAKSGIFDEDRVEGDWGNGFFGTIASMFRNLFGEDDDDGRRE